MKKLLAVLLVSIFCLAIAGMAVAQGVGPPDPLPGPPAVPPGPPDPLPGPPVVPPGRP